MKLKRILVIDDEANVTTLLRLLFERTKEYEVKVENTSSRAVAAAEKFQPDLILLDVDMPDMNGGELASRFSENSSLKAVPVVFLTGSVTKDEVRTRDGLVGGLRFLAEPVDRSEVLDCVRKHFKANRTEGATPQLSPR